MRGIISRFIHLLGKLKIVNAALILRHHFFYRWKHFEPLYFILNKHNGDIYKRNCRKTVILMARNETVFCGGLSDRFRGIISVYQECKNQGLDFKIYFETPHLTDFILPNQYDWHIEQSDICYDMKRVYPCTLLSYHSLSDKNEPTIQKRILQWYLKKNYEQIHVYTNMRSGDNDYSVLFHELFKPVKPLQIQIDEHVKALGGIKQFMAVVFRFRQLLGDFKEGGITLPENERIQYIERCMDVVKRIHSQSLHKKILVTSDSVTFLNNVSKLPYVHVIPGNVVHVGFTYDATKDIYMKSFVDYFVLAYAEKVILVRDKQMYHSGFALRAAMLNGANYQEMWM